MADVSFIKEHLKADSFKVTNFSKREIIESLSAKLVQAAREKPREFDPTPFVRTFESALDELKRVRKNFQRKIDDLEDDEAGMERTRRKKMGQIHGAFEGVSHAFETLESQIGEVGNTAIRIGEQLETIDRQRTRALEAKELIEFYMEFNAGKSAKLEALASSGPEGEQKSAIVLRRLSAIAKDVDIPGTETARTHIERFCEDMETKILDVFDKAYKNGDKATMKHCARTLYDFNGGGSSVQLYVNQHEFFMSRLRLGDSLLPAESYFDALATSPTPPSPEPQLGRLCNEISITTRQEWQVISSVFPNAGSVMQNFVQRIFAQSIQTYVENSVRAAGNESDLAFLRCLSSSHATISALVADLQKFDANTIAIKSPSGPALANVLERSFTDLFVPYTEGARYTDRECGSLVECFEEVLEPFRNYTAAKKSPTKKQHKPLLPTHAVLGAQSVAQLLNIGGTSMTEKVTSDNDLSLLDAASLPSADVTLKLLSIHLEAIRRCKELSAPSDMPNNIKIIFERLLEHVGRSYLEMSIDMFMEAAFPHDSKITSEPDVRSLALVAVANQVLQLLQLHFQNFILPLVMNFPAVHRDLVVVKNHYMSSVEARLNKLLEKQIDVIQKWIDLLLSKQKRTDYRPKDDGAAANVPSVTQPCQGICDYLRKVCGQASKCLTRDNSDLFLGEIGTELHQMLLEHVKKFSISMSGGLTLAKDLASYQETVSTFGISSLSERFSLLRELANAYIAKPESLRSVIYEGLLGRIDPALLAPYISLRADWGKRIEKELFVRTR
ncbi:hypothetical protein SeMB42_g00272 [Synchytrium endobioticum]|uniref:Uncharacterized protein n=1 Tax=Synchytrium endobioticum TaxID=286115 RepID=A0A507DIP0_9FUNG|nr:hypothetical protein SeLEV6574_g00395 [Synchytrium endobioticum]TPX54424.1 hypothetical protein SeMB42_g00272 [Synchytrium endobioticum]